MTSEPDVETAGPDAGGALPTLIAARETDVPDIVALMNHAYRGTDAGKGWTTEAGYIAGTRTTDTLLRADLLQSAAATYLLWRLDDGSLLGCVRMEAEPEDVWYLGGLSVLPGAQNGGVGRRLLAAAEAWAQARGGREMRLTVIHIRASLIAWYERRGYRTTGETEEFPYGDDRFGTPLRDDLHFIIMRKPLPLQHLSQPRH